MIGYSMVTSDDHTLLTGLENLLDDIADYCHDVHGIDCLLTESPEDRFPIEDWRYEVANGDTRMGYAEWLEHRIEMERYDAEREEECSE